ncbi:succinate dehydrogenase cytochrome b560 subunit, mitochondrial-like [Diaphorina citri]|uniref:Succinate dehydrogenase cytochrome b560 subunit, mitochondrial-like n=1 Tax=Diaphorina citri TaxID=121845 RepID=A0A1S3CXN2_DIACI|nr:succinate dehydrogenase cytochrome b560 subunit, mitochondrial-like [Diaphorina citri]
MNSIFKLSTLCNPIASSHLRLLPHIRTITIKPVAAPTGVPSKEGHAVRNERLGRPLSPHLTIYKLQITSVLSITHRGTGVALTAYALGLAGVGLTTDINSVVSFVDALNLSAPILLAGKFILGIQKKKKKKKIRIKKMRNSQVGMGCS